MDPITISAIIQSATNTLASIGDAISNSIAVKNHRLEVEDTNHNYKIINNRNTIAEIKFENNGFYIISGLIVILLIGTIIIAIIQKNKKV